MNVPNTDLLPPLFDKIRASYARATGNVYVRSDIVRALENGLINAAADHQREREAMPGHAPRSDPIDLRTVDRLSGEHLSRAALTEQIQSVSLLDASLVEIALLMIEAQIDLRLGANRKFKLGGIEFALPEGAEHNVAAWCRGVLEPALRGTAGDVPTFWSRVGQRVPEGIRTFAEALPLSAALREAAPYTIRVDRRLVDPLLDKPRAEGHIRVLHVSDLHLVENLLDPRGGGSPTLGQKKHNEAAASMLGRVTWQLQPRVDLLVATGDLTTDGKRGSFETLLQFVQGGPVSGENKQRIAIFGLNAGPANRLLLPGNHDRYAGEFIPGQRLSNTFEQVLGTPYPYPYLRAFRPANQPPESLTLLVFVFDSSLPEGATGKSPQELVDSLAKGWIRQAEVDQMTELARQAAMSETAEAVDGSKIKFKRDNTVRIALLHHHPVARFVPPELQQPQPTFWSALRHPIESVKAAFARREEAGMVLDGADAFLAGCFNAGIQVVLFGHLHKPYRRAVMLADGPRADANPELNGPRTNERFGPITHLRTFCCPTTLERSEHGNGFYLFDFMDKEAFAIHYYLSRPGDDGSVVPFSRISDASGQFALGQLTDEEKRMSYVLQRQDVSRTF
jgi:hypothetical protein